MKNRIILATFLLSFITILFSCSSNTPENAAVKMTELISKQEYIKARNNFYFGSGIGYQEQQNLDKLFIFMAENEYQTMEKEGGLKSAKAIKTSINPTNKDKAIVMLKLRFNNGNESEYKVDCIKINEKWNVMLKK